MRNIRPSLRWICLWIFTGLIFASQLYLFAMRSGWQTTLGQVMLWEMIRWTFWIPFTPMILRLCRQYEIDPPHTRRRLLQHTAFSILFSLMHLLLFTFGFWIWRTFELSFGTSFFAEFANRLAENVAGEPLQLFLSTFPLDFHVGLIVYWGIVLTRHALDSRQRAARLQAELAKAQLHTLKMQVHPHFLFNTLNSIAGLLHRDAEAAEEMIGELGHFLRQSLQTSNEDQVPLSKELEFLQSYLAIERVRFGNRLSIVLDVEPQVLDAQVPYFILQPLVENALRHGIASSRSGGKITITAKQSGGHLHMIVSDDGPGASPDSREGIGLLNIRERLRVLYGSDAQMELKNQPEGGLQVSLRMPYTVMKDLVTTQ